MQVSRYIFTIKKFFTRKRIIWTVGIFLVLLVGWLIFGRNSGAGNIQTALVKRVDVQKTVLTTGQVVSSTDLSLSFQTSGVVRGVYVKEGDSVRAGQTLAVLDQGNSGASLESAKAAEAEAEANYNKIVAAASTQDVAVSEAGVAAASTSLENAKSNLLRDLGTAYGNTSVAVLSNTNILFSNPQSSFPQFGISGTVQTNPQLVTNVNAERLLVNTALDTWGKEVTTLSFDNMSQVTTDSLSYLSTVNNYLADILSLLTTYSQNSGSASQATLASYITSVSGAKSSVISTSALIAGDMQAISNATAALAQAKASLQLKKAPARSEDVSIAEARVLSAQAGVHAAEATLRNTLIIAPINGTITQVDIKLGEQAVAGKEAIKLLNVGQLHTEAAVSEADIASVEVGQSIDNTFDALGPDKHFTSKVLSINPASTVVSGVVNYKVTGSLDAISGVKPGMTANMTILVAEKKNALVAPRGAIINKNGKEVVKVIDDPKKKTYHEVEVKTGLEADGGVTEILSGLTEGENIVTYVK